MTSVLGFCDSIDSEKSPTELVKFSSSSRTRTQSTTRKEPFDSLHIDRKLVIESLTPPSYPIEPLYMSELTTSTYSHILQLQHASLFIAESIPSIAESIPPHGCRSQLVQFFLKYHRENITEAHYLRWYDYPKLCTSIIFSLAETSDALQHAMVAFSALIFSIKINHRAREIALLYYSVALRQLRLSLDKSDMDMTDCFTSVATALQLSSFDVSLYSLLADFSDFSETSISLSGIFKEPRVFCSWSPIRRNYAQVSSVARFSIGSCNLRITAA